MMEGNKAGGEENLFFFRPSRERGSEGERERDIHLFSMDVNDFSIHSKLE